MKTFRPSGTGSATPPTGTVIRQGNNGTEAPIHQAETPEFPLQYLGTVLCELAIAICKIERVPASLAGCCLLGVVSASVGAGLQVRSGPHRTTRANLYILGSAESGSGKSETFRHAARPFQRFEAERLKAWRESTRPRLLADKEIREAEIGMLKRKATSPKGSDSLNPILDREELRDSLERAKAALAEVEAALHTPALSCDDITTERLAALLSQNDEQLASLSADAVAVVSNLLGRYSKLPRTDEGVYLKAFSGDYCRVDRQSAEPILLLSPCLAALWLTQPDKLESLLAEPSLCEGGLIPRVLACHTRCEPRPILGNVPEIPPIVAEAYQSLICDLLSTYRLADTPFFIEPIPEALALLNDHHNEIVMRRHNDLRDVTIFAARWNEQAWRIAVCLHAALHGREAHYHLLSFDTARQAIDIADWFSSQQLEILSASRNKAKRKTVDAILALLAESPKGITARDIQRARVVLDAKSCHTLLTEMEADGHLSGVDHKPEGGGHVTRIYKRLAQ